MSLSQEDRFVVIARELMFAMFDVAKAGNRAMDFSLYSQFSQILACIESARDISGSRSGATNVRGLRRAQILAFIEANLHLENLSLNHVAARFNISARTIQNLFSKKAGDESLPLYIRKRRLERCHEELSNAMICDQSITEIAFRWGFRSSSHFSRCFHSHFGSSPRTIRKTHQSPRAPHLAQCIASAR
jgi:transcriptional regulator GlxA family with amidase domain